MSATAFTPNPGQRRAIEAPLGAPTRVMAGAGTGKTEVISRRFVHLLRQDPGLLPEHFLVLTFSEKAAAEMRARIFRAVTTAPGLARAYTRLDLAGAAISTFHSFAARLLRDHSLAVGIDPDLPLLSDIDFESWLDELKDQFFESGYRGAYPAGFEPLEQDVYAWENDEPLADARKILSQLRNQAVNPEDFRQKVVGLAGGTPRHQVLAPLVHWLYRAFAERLAQAGQLDFDQMIMGSAELLERDPALQQALRRQYRVLLVDEFQDTNHAQARLLAALAATGLSNVTVVGDPRQAIYVWREARVENIAGFPARGPAHNPALTENRRSLKPILEVANRAIAGYQFGDPPEFPAGDELKPCAEKRAFTGTVVSLHAESTREAEAQLIADYIRQARAQGHVYEDIALLLRARTYLATYTDALTAAGIPFELSAEDAFYTRPEILDAIHLLQICVDPARDLSVARVLLSPAVGLSQAQAASLKRTGRRGAPLWLAVTQPEGAAPEVAERLRGLADFWQAAQAEQWLRSPAAFVDWALGQSGLAAAADPVGQRALRKLLALAHAYEAEQPAAAVRDLVTHLRQVLDSAPREKAPEMRPGAKAVTILTAHASKGLEFPIVIAADSRLKVTSNKDKAPFHEPGAGLIFPQDDETAPEFLEHVRREWNEDRCLWYVTLTRAKERLIITATNSSERPDDRYAKPKTFFEELWNMEAVSPTPGVELDRPRPKPVDLDLGSDGSTHSVGSTPPDDAAVRDLSARLAVRLAPAKSEIRFSPSAFHRYQACPAAYRYNYVTRLGGLPVLADPDEGSLVDDVEPEAGNSGGAQMGTLFHAAVAAHARMAAPATAEDLLGAVNADERAMLSREQLATVRGWLERYLQSDLGRARPTPESVERELTLTLPFATAELVMRGKADRLEPCRLVDFKTDSKGDGLVARYGDQLRLYALAARQAGWLQPDAELAIYHAPTSKYLTVSFTPQDEARLMGELGAFAENLAQPNPAFPPVRSDLCRWCAAREIVCEPGRRRAQR